MLCSPNHLKTFSKKSLATPMALMVFRHGMRITPFIRLWLTMTIKKSNSRELGRLVMRSIKSCLSRRVNVERMGCRGGVMGWVFILFC